MDVMATMETKYIGGIVSQCKEIEIDGKLFGVVEGHIATFDVDRGDDRFSPGAFAKSLEELKRIGKTQLPLKDAHGRTIGGFPMETLIEDQKGLFGVGLINLEIELGRDAYALAKQRVYDSFSIGFIPQDIDFIDQIREIREAEVLEGSLLDIPMNLNARVTEVKAIAEKLGINIDKLDDAGYKDFVEHMEGYLKKLNDDKSGDKVTKVESLKNIDERTLEGLFKKGVRFSGTIAKALVRVIKASDLREAEKEVHREGGDDWSDVLDELKQIEKIMED